MKLANNDEPILLSGPTCYKTYASKILLNNGYIDYLDQEFKNKEPVIVSLNQESTISQLLGSPFFYTFL